MDPIEGILGGWGAILSTILAIDQLRQRRRGRVILRAAWHSPTDELRVEIVNIGERPVTVGSVDVVYGESARRISPLVYVSTTSVRLEDGEAKSWALSRRMIIQARETTLVQIGRRNLVWARANLLGAGQKVASVAIDADTIGATGLYARAEQSIAADLFVGFSRDEVIRQARDVSFRPT